MLLHQVAQVSFDVAPDFGQAELDLEPSLTGGEFLAVEAAREAAYHVVVKPQLVLAHVADRSFRQDEPELRAGCGGFSIPVLSVGGHGRFGRDVDLIAGAAGREGDVRLPGGLEL